MGNKKQNKKPAVKDTAAKNAKTNAVQKNEEGKRRRSATEKFMIIFGAVALVAIIASIIVGVVVSTRANYTIDFMNDDLSKFIYIAESDYKNFEADIKVDPVDDYDVRHAILQMLAANKAKEPEFKTFRENKTITAGDIVRLYYRGYTLGEGGEKNYFDGGCNFANAPHELEIGAATGKGFITGFELNLVGKNQKDYGTFKKLEAMGIIGATDKIFVSYVRELSDQTVMALATKVINLADGIDAIDKEFGNGFYNNIVGKQYGPSNVLSFEVSTDNGTEKYKDVTVYRATGAGDLIQLTYSALRFDGTVAQGETAIIDLSDPKLDEKWGAGFTKFFELGAPVGTKALNVKGESATINTVVGENEQNQYFNITVNYVYEINGTPLTIEAYFPTDYGNSEELAGKTAFFEVFIKGTQVWDAPEYNEAFITDTLKLTAEDLAEYEGANLVEKHTAKVKAELEEKYEELYNSAVENAIWTQYVEKAQIKRLPEQNVREFYDSYYAEIENGFMLNQYSYQSIDMYAREQLGLASNADWRAELRKAAEKTLTQQLAFYYVMRQEGLVVSDEEYSARYEDVYKEVEEKIDEYIEQYFKRDSYDSDEKFEQAKADYKKNTLANYTEEYFRERITYEYAFETLRTYVIPKA